MMKITCWMPWRTAAMTARSLSLSVLENRLFAATCAVSVVSCAALGRGKLWRPALVNWGLYSFEGSQLGELGGP